MRTVRRSFYRRQPLIRVFALLSIAATVSASCSEGASDEPESFDATREQGAAEYNVELKPATGETINASGLFDFETSRGKVEIASSGGTTPAATYVFADDDVFIRFGDQLIPPFLIEAGTPWIHIDLETQGDTPTAQALGGATFYVLNLQTALSLAAEFAESSKTTSTERGATSSGAPHASVVAQARRLIPATPVPDIAIARGAVRRIHFPRVQQFSVNANDDIASVTIDITPTTPPREIAVPPTSDVIALDRFTELNQRAASESSE